MSKSSGNVVLVSDVVARGLDPLALRLAFLQHRYRQQMNLTWDALTAADTRRILRAPDLNGRAEHLPEPPRRPVSL